ncbi:alternative oxidase-domain-containing protein [Schizophyllum amplum]|uniref:Alternative oxidase n=1 Tax=Schizophyllum amplum TaxID=97359 RepID=A0A550CGY4_9AGAR|nr:alternative oxidase-domain-containing protein [Auriculariopsis ampla]
MIRPQILSSTTALRVVPMACTMGSRTFATTAAFRAAANIQQRTTAQHAAAASSSGQTRSESSAAGSPLTKQDAVSTVPQQPPTFTGDWLLFHPVYKADEVKAVEVVHQVPTKLSDRVAYRLVKLCRWGFDVVSGYKAKPLPADAHKMTLQKLREDGYVLGPDAWLNRFLFLESIAGVPGMVAATLRHLQSLRLMRRDNGWIHTCLEEAENERMHLMTFMTLRKHSIFFRALILGAQGVFYNMFFLTYLFMPAAAHRFVGYLEEEAVRTYSHCIQDIENNLVPEWRTAPAPQIAIDYWRLSQDASILDVVYAVRADESTHRFVNHSLANLNQKTDVNPFAIREPDMHTKGHKISFNRDEAATYVEESRQLLERQSKTGTEA